MTLHNWHIVFILLMQFIFTLTALPCTRPYEKTGDEIKCNQINDPFFTTLLDNNVNSIEVQDRYRIMNVLSDEIPDGYIISDVLSSKWPAQRGNIMERYPPASNETWIVALTDIDLSADDPKPALIQVWIPCEDDGDTLLVQQLLHRGYGGPSNPTVIEDMGWFVMGGKRLFYVIAVLNRWNCRSVSVFSVDENCTHINLMFEEAFLTDGSPIMLQTADCLNVGFAAYHRPWASNVEGPDYGSLELAIFDIDGNRTRYYLELENLLNEEELARSIVHEESSITVSNEIMYIIIYQMAMRSDWWDRMTDITHETWAQIEKQENEGWAEMDLSVQE